MAPDSANSANRFAQHSSLSGSDSPPPALSSDAKMSDTALSAGRPRAALGTTAINSDDSVLEPYCDTGSSTDLDTPVDEPLCHHVERVVRQYFTTLGEDIPTDLYQLILQEVERPLLTVVLEQTRGNQSKSAQILGLNRGTLRKKLKTYQLM